MTLHDIAAWRGASILTPLQRHAAARRTPPDPARLSRPRAERPLFMARGGKLARGAARRARPAQGHRRAAQGGKRLLRAGATAPLKSLRETLVAEMRGRIKEDDADPPWPDGPFAYFARYREGGEHPLYCRTKRGGGDEEILLDGDALAQGAEFFDIGETVHAPVTTRSSAGASTIRAPNSIPSARAH